MMMTKVMTVIMMMNCNDDYDKDNLDNTRDNNYIEKDNNANMLIIIRNKNIFSNNENKISYLLNAFHL